MDVIKEDELMMGGVPDPLSVNQLQAKSGPLKIGSATSGHSLTATNDLLIAGKLEVDGIAYVDSGELIVAPVAAETDAYLSLKTTRGTDREWRIIAGDGAGGVDPKHLRIRDAEAAVERLAIDGSGNVGIGKYAFGTNAAGVLGIANGTEPSTGPTDMIQIYSKDNTEGTPGATLGIRTENAVEAIGTFTPSHKLRVWINGVEYWIELDAV